MNVLCPQDKYFTQEELWSLCFNSPDIPKTQNSMKVKPTILGQSPILPGIDFQERFVDIAIHRTKPELTDVIVLFPSHFGSPNLISESRAAVAPKFLIESILLNGEQKTSYKKLLQELEARPTVVKSVTVSTPDGRELPDLALDICAKSLWNDNQADSIEPQAIEVGLLTDSGKSIQEGENYVSYVFDLLSAKKYLAGKKEFSLKGLGDEPIIKVKIYFNESYDLFD